MDYLKELKRLLGKDRKKIISTLKNEKTIRDSSPSAMQSHHDTTRNQTEKLIQALELQLKELEDKLKEIPDKSRKTERVSLWNVVQINLVGNEMQVLLVPEGLGGKNMGAVKTLAVTTPLGQAIMNKKESHKFVTNAGIGKIKKIL
jgi:predicted phage tail protein